MISIIMPIKNGEKYIKECVNSIINQSYKKWELICVVDTSKDKTWSIIQNYAREDYRINAVHGNDYGPGSARNYGISKARGDYYAFIDSDDILSPNYLEMLITYAKKYRADIVCCNYSYDKKSIDKKKNPNKMENNTDRFNIIEECTTIFSSYVGWAWDKLFKADFCIKNRVAFGNNYILEDGFFVFPALAKAKTILQIDNCLIYHRRHINSLQKNRINFESNWNDIILNSTGIYAQIRDLEIYQNLRPDFCRWIINYSLWCLRRIRLTQVDLKRRSIIEHLHSDFDFSEKDYKKYAYIEDYYAYKKIDSDKKSIFSIWWIWKIRKIIKLLRIIGLFKT